MEDPTESEIGKNFLEASQFLALLDPSSKVFTFQTFDDSKKSDPALTRVLHGGLRQCWAELLALNEAGAGVFVTVNETDLKGRKAENIKSIRAIWQDDDVGHKGKYPLAPSIVVRTSSGKHQRYWLTEKVGRIPFEGLMHRLIEAYGADPAAKDIARVLRLRGFMHRKNEPQLVKLVGGNCKRYHRAELIRAFGPLPRAKRNIPSVAEDRPEANVRIAQALKFIPNEDRTVWLYVGMALHDASEGSEEAYAMWVEWSRSSSKYDAKDQLANWKSFSRKEGGITLGWLFREAGKHGWCDEREVKELSTLPTVNLENVSVGFVDEMSPISSRAIAQVRVRFEEYKHFPSSFHWQGLKLIAKAIELMAFGNLKSGFYVSFLPPGMGKTTTLIEATRALISMEQLKHVGIIIFVARLEEIKALVALAGLSESEFAVVASADKVENRLGCQDDKTRARVLFTTQQGLQTRSQDGARFDSMAAFFYMGKPRQVRVWDEAILPSMVLTLGQYDISNLLKTLNKEKTELADELAALFNELGGKEDQSLIQIPDVMKHEVPLEEALAWFTDEDDKKAIEALWSMSGRTIRVRDDRISITALDYKDILPGDLAPMLILDASGQQRKTYELWHRGRKDLYFLHSAQKLYNGLTIHHWDRGAGKDAHRKDWETIADGVAKVISVDIPPDEEVLVIHFKKSRYVPDMAAEINKRIWDKTGKVSFCNWGRHTATNQYAHVKYVVLAGILQYPTSQNEGFGRGALGIEAEDELSEEDFLETRFGEVAHNIFQATNRGMVRKSVGEGCPEGCHLYIIFSTSKGSGVPQGLLKRIFPGALLKGWVPLYKPRGKYKKIVELIASAAVAGQSKLLKADLSRDLGITRQHNLNRDLKHADVTGSLRDKGWVFDVSRDWIHIKSAGAAKMEFEGASKEELFLMPWEVS